MRRADLDPDPYRQFERWFAQARAARLPVPEAMTLATATPDGRPSARTVLLNGVDDRGFRLHTNYESRKGRELAENARAALLFLRHLEPRRQVLVEGTVSRVPREELGAYFRTRPRGGQVQAWASRQSSPIGSRVELERAYEAAERAHPAEIPLPDWWGGYAVAPDRFEFWESGENRLHDRFQYVPDGTGAWTIERLSP
jgi:pyridoxamine 5'-phosphate oxidase